MMRRVGPLLLALCACLGADRAAAQGGPSDAVRSKALRSLVHVLSIGCPGGERAGSGFVVDGRGVVTAHHVVGGCTTFQLTFEGVPKGGPRLHGAKIVHVLAAHDLAILSVDEMPDVPVLQKTDERKSDSLSSGLGYQNGQPSPGDIELRFSQGPHHLDDILPASLRQELEADHTRIDFEQDVLRFGSPLQPGMSGGPIIDDDGRVIGIVAGGLKAGAAPASWGWPAHWLDQLGRSTEPTDTPVSNNNVYYTYREMRAEHAARTERPAMTCGQLSFEFKGTKSFDDVARGADDQQRLLYLLSRSKLSLAEIQAFQFDVWSHQPSGATLVVPAGHAMRSGPNGECIARSSRGPFTQYAWSTNARDAAQMQQSSAALEREILSRRGNFAFGVWRDDSLTTPGPQVRPNGSIFQRKGLRQPKGPLVYGRPLPEFSHIFETLIAKAGAFLGVVTLDETLPPDLQNCAAISYAHPACAATREHVKEWSHFILATQLSTFPAT